MPPMEASLPVTCHLPWGVTFKSFSALLPFTCKCVLGTVSSQQWVPSACQELLLAPCVPEQWLYMS